MGMESFNVTHKNYTAKFEFDRDGYFYGKIIDIPDLVMIMAKDEIAAKRETKIAVDDYITHLEKFGYSSGA